MSEHLQPYQAGGSTPYGQGQVGWAPGGVVRQQAGAVVGTNQSTSVWVVVVAWVFAVGTLGYFLPWAIAASRGKSNQAAIGLINFLTGWTFIGWIAALVMACGRHQSVYVGGTQVNVLLAQPQQPQAGYAPHPALPAQGAPTATYGAYGTQPLDYAPTQPLAAAPMPPAGWFPDPEGPGQRYWDGQSWTEHRAP